MSNLIKSEWYRITHSRPSLPIIILGMLGCALISFLGGEMLDFKRNSVSQTGVMSIYLCAIVLSSLVDTSYTNCIAFYEIMDGKSPNQIIMSKLVVYTPLALICCYSTVSALLLIFDGGAETVKFILLLFFVFVRGFLSTIFTSMIFKSKDSAALALARMMVESLILMFSKSTENTTQLLPHAFEWLIMGQLFNMGINVNGDLTAKVIIGCICEVSVMYVLTYMSYKRKWMIKTTIL